MIFMRFRGPQALNDTYKKQGGWGPLDYRWFAIAAKGALLPISCDQGKYDANLVALPVERTEEFLGLLGQK
jgi:hypothetical protein